MSVTVEHIKKEIRALSPEEVEKLLRDLQEEYAMTAPAEMNEATIEAEWDKEIARRVKDIEGGKVRLISGAELEQSIDALFAKRGIQRRA